MTPLLDWTTDYRVAAYFAFREIEAHGSRYRGEPPVAIWALPLAYGLPHSSVWNDRHFPRVVALTLSGETQVRTSIMSTLGSLANIRS